MYHFCCCAQYFVALAFSSAFFVFFVVTLCPCNILMAFIIFDKSSCIMFAVVRSTLLLWHVLLHSLFFRSYLVSLQYFHGFYHIRQEFMYHVCCCAQYFVAFAFSFAFFVFSYLPCVPAIFSWLLSYSTRVHVSCLLLCAVLCCFCIFFCILCFFVVTLCPCNILMAFITFDKSSCIMFAVVRSTLLFLSFHLHSSCLRNQPVFPQFF